MTNSEQITLHAIDSLIWKVVQNFSTTIVFFIIQIVLARLLSPSDYGVIALTNVFITISLVFVQTGFTAAMIQKKHLNDIEINSVFYLNIIFSILFYILIYIFTPLIANFYSEPLLINVLRIQSLVIPITAFYAIPSTLIQRDLLQKKTFLPGFLGSLLQGFSGIILAKSGFKVWSLVISSLVYSLTYCVILLINTSWRPRLQFSMSAALKLIPFSSKYLINNLINVTFKNFISLLIGKMYKPDILGYYNRGYQIPVLLMTNIDGAISSVIFPVLSKYQEDHKILIKKLRKSLQISVYFVWPIMVGMAIVAKPLIITLLTEKWLQSVVFLQLTAITCMLWPFSVFLHALNSIGKSGIALKLNVFAKIVEILLLIITYRMGIVIFVSSSLFSIIISSTVIIMVSSKIFEFKIRDIIMDLIPTMLVTIFMGIIIYYFKYIISNSFILLVVQILVGIIFYLSVTWLLRFPSLVFIKVHIFHKN